MKSAAALLLTTVIASADTTYVIAVSERTAADAAWRPVVEKLTAKHHATVLTYAKDPGEILAGLRREMPRYTCFVAQPGEATRAFVQNIHLDATKRAIVGACALLGREMGMQVVAEGVETAQELQGIETAGCSAAQGFLIARPMPGAHATLWLENLLAQRHAPEVCLPTL